MRLPWAGRWAGATLAATFTLCQACATEGEGGDEADDGMGASPFSQAGASSALAGAAAATGGVGAGMFAGNASVAGAAAGVMPIPTGGTAGGAQAAAGEGGMGPGAGTGGTSAAMGNPPDAGGSSSTDGGAGDTGAGDAGAALDAGTDAGPRDASDGQTDMGCVGRITYSLAMAANPTSDQQQAYERITEAMDTALAYYNCYTELEKALQVSYEPSVATADGNPNGSIRFGSMESMNYITAMHEISHTLGVGDNTWDSMIVDGIFPGQNATAQLRAITGDPTAEVHGDNQHFWPYGLNYVDEVMSEQDLIDHCLMVVAIRKDLGYD